VGKRGPAPAPTALKLIKGVHKHNPDRVNRSEPVPAADVVAPPVWLSEEARQLWDQLAPDLERQGVLKPWDCEEFGVWCDAAARRREAAGMLTTGQSVTREPVMSKSGELVGHKLVRNPWTLVLKDTTDTLLRFGARFGLTPSDRSQLKVGDGNANPTDDLLTG
jgi:P27 family predicted phage terminase small subunit